MNSNNEQCYIAFEPKEVHMALIENINALFGGQDVGQQAAVQRAMAHVLKLNAELDEEKLAQILQAASKTKVAVRPGITVPKAVKVEVKKEDLETVENIFRHAFQIFKLQRPFFARVLLTTYFLHLREENARLGVPEEPVSTDTGEDNFAGGDDALFRFKVSVEMADMLLRNAPEDKIYIRQILEMAKKRGIT